MDKLIFQSRDREASAHMKKEKERNKTNIWRLNNAFFSHPNNQTENNKIPTNDIKNTSKKHL